MNNTNTEERARQIIEEAMKTLPKEEHSDLLNYFPDDAFEKKPTHRVDFFYTNGGHTSSPATFSSDKEAVNAAIQEAQFRNDICGGVCSIKVKKYTGEYDSNGLNILKVIYEKIMNIPKESLNGETPYDEMDGRLQEIGDAHVSRFYCDENQITLAVNMNTGSEGRMEAESIMKDFGYKLYDLGINEPYVMMTFKRM